MKPSLILAVMLLAVTVTSGQTTVGMGIYPTGTDPAFGFRLNKDRRWNLDARLAKTNFYSDSKTGQSAFITELSFVYRAVLMEKVRFYLGPGFRGEWNLVTSHKYGAVLPIGVEAFPFPFQNAGLIFEVAPYCVSDLNSKLFGGVRTVAGFVFYFPKKSDKKPA